MPETNELEKKLKCVWRVITEHNKKIYTEHNNNKLDQCYQCNGFSMGCIGYVPLTKYYERDWMNEERAV